MCPFPVGYVYLSSNNTSPATTYGGTWSPLNESRYLRLAGAWGTGGSNTISVDQMPKHTHRPTSGELTDGFVTGGSSGIRGANITINGTGYVIQQTTQPAGGGQHFIQVTEMCTHGIEPLKVGVAYA